MKTRYLILSACFVFFCIFPINKAFSQSYDPGIRDTVRFGDLVTHVNGPPCQMAAVLPVIVFNDEFLGDLKIPLEWTGSMVIDSGRFAGEREPYIHFGGFFIDNFYKKVMIWFTMPEGYPYVPPGDDTLAYLYFSVLDSGFVWVDTTWLPPSNWVLSFVDSLFNRILPYFPGSREYHISIYLSGDVNQNGVVDIGDVVYLISYLYRQGSPPDPIELGDVNGDCIVNLGDIVYLINYLYKNGPSPKMGCAS